jgi:mannose-6-phosphate isomerase-like protein (cupin superfamily)
MAGVVLRAGEGEQLFGGRIVLKADFEQLTITESLFPDARPGAGPHFHRQHADSFYVLEGGFTVLVHDEEHPLPPNGCACAPPGVVHGFRSMSRTRFLNFHTPDGGFADHLRAQSRREKGGFDSFDAEPGSGAPPTEAVVLGPGEGERLMGETRVATI